MMAGRAIHWDPIPRHANLFMLLNVDNLTETFSRAGTELTVVVSFATDQPESPISTWRITFESVVAYSKHPMRSGRGEHKLTVVLPAEGGRSDAPLREAAWEVVHSDWLAENTPHNFSFPNAVHHYVIADAEDVYEIAAVGWSSEQLDEQSIPTLSL